MKSLNDSFVFDRPDELRDFLDQWSAGSATYERFEYVDEYACEH
jgi:hypothetical protein